MIRKLPSLLSLPSQTEIHAQKGGESGDSKNDSKNDVDKGVTVTNSRSKTGQ